jgi:hypothetical protein
LILKHSLIFSIDGLSFNASQTSVKNDAYAQKEVAKDLS